MASQGIQTDKAPAAIGPYSQGIIAPPFVFVSGQLGFDPATGEMVGSAFAAQARQALKNLQQVLLAGECQLSDVTAVDVFVTDLNHFAEFNAIYTEFFGDFKPARAVVEVSALPKGGLIEVKCIACRTT